ncbi:MAG: hypothetical protein JXB85_15390 [Anaerolineales bacterium]|nr:hypothetical protein [Anaerolineales bacterium]
MQPANESQSEERAAIVVRIQSWATPIVGVIALLVGLFAGYYGRPVMERSLEPTSTSTAAATVIAQPTATPTPGSQVPTPNTQLMAMAMAEVRHFQGNPDAPVTFLEFSDFQ